MPNKLPKAPEIELKIQPCGLANCKGSEFLQFYTQQIFFGNCAQTRLKYVHLVLTREKLDLPCHSKTAGQVCRAKFVMAVHRKKFTQLLSMIMSDHV
jgi:hypothetical protein